MTVLTLNNTDFNITGYNRYTSVDNGVITSNASVYFPDNSGYSDLAYLAESTITSISISIDGSTVYSLTNQNAKITSISENLDERGVTMQAQITFNSAVNE